MGKKVLIIFSLFFFFCFSFYSKDKMEKTPIRETSLIGNNSFSVEEVLKGAGWDFTKRQLKKKKLMMTEEECVELSESISSFYKREGFFDVSVIKNQKDKIFEIIIEEGKPYIITFIKTATESEDEASHRIVKETMDRINLKEGNRFRIEDYESAKAELEKAFGNSGYPFVKVIEKAEVNVKEKDVSISYSIEEGQQATFGKTTFEGIVHTEEKILRKLLKYKEGEIYQVSKIEETKEALYSTGLFDIVTIKVKKPDEFNSAPIKIILKEGRHRKVKLSAGYGADEKLRFQAGFETLRLFDRCLTAGFNFKKSNLEESYEFHLIRPYAVSDYSGYVRARKQASYWVQTQFDTTSLTAGIERKFSSFSASFDINYEEIRKIKFSHPSPPIKDNALEPETLFVRFNVIHNKTDNFWDPSRGRVLQFGIEGDRVSNGVKFGKFWVDFRKYYSLKNHSVLAFKFKAASLATRSSIVEVPYPYRFFTGGQMRLRGYRFSSISPLSDNFSLEGGKGLFESSVEYRFPFRDNFKGVVFFETGRATRKSNPFAGDAHFKSDIGFGIRYLTPVGPVGMDIAFRLNKAEYSSSPFQIALFIGYAF
ncbi:MAG: BamA/TamA family outer membrane protein [Acidobacteria bacterium]|nr:BamA/TamA family outer membrane protein [Acidobacteriota bacterium]